MEQDSSLIILQRTLSPVQKGYRLNEVHIPMHLYIQFPEITDQDCYVPQCIFQ